MIHRFARACVPLLLVCAQLAVCTPLALAASPATAASPAGTATPGPSPAPSADDVVPDRYVRGQVLTIARGFIVFTTGDALRLRPGTIVPKRVTVGSTVRVTLDQLSRDVKAIEYDPPTALAGEIDAPKLGREYVVSSPQSAQNVQADATPAPVGQTVSITIAVEVPANTPIGDSVFVATDRSSYSPAEVRMQQIDSRHFTVALSLAAGTRLYYEFTRGSNATIERARNGDILQPHELLVAPNAKVEDGVARWADLN